MVHTALFSSTRGCRLLIPQALSFPFMRFGFVQPAELAEDELAPRSPLNQTQSASSSLSHPNRGSVRRLLMKYLSPRFGGRASSGF